jgi:hypothetical protein
VKRQAGTPAYPVSAVDEIATEHATLIVVDVMAVSAGCVALIDGSDVRPDRETTFPAATSYALNP